jgi:hypothetical protein
MNILVVATFFAPLRVGHPMDGQEFTREVMPGTNVEDREGLMHFTPMVFRQRNFDGALLSLGV